MTILSLDCASGACAAALWNKGEVLALAQESMERGQDARLIPLVEELLAQADLAYADLSRLAVTKGPGSFTGIRIALAAACGLSLAAQKPVLGIERFQLYRHAVGAGQDLLVVLASKRRELYAQFFPGEGAAGAPFMAPAEDLLARNDLRVTGDCPDLFAPGVFLPLPRPEVILAAELAAKADPADPAFAPTPFYLREPDVTFPKGAPA